MLGSCSAGCGQAVGLISNIPPIHYKVPSTVYLQFSPDGAVDNLVKAGATIVVGQTLGYINVLSKLLPIVSDVAGVVDALLVADGDGVEYGQPIVQLC